MEQEKISYPANLDRENEKKRKAEETGNSNENNITNKNLVGPIGTAFFIIIIGIMIVMPIVPLSQLVLTYNATYSYYIYNTTYTSNESASNFDYNFSVVDECPGGEKCAG